MEKVKVSKELGDEIELCLEYWTRPSLVRFYVEDEQFRKNKPFLSRMDLDTFIRALYIGYEVEQTPEDRIKDMHREWVEKMTVAYKNQDEDAHKKYKCRIQGALETLTILGIQIEGVND